MRARVKGLPPDRVVAVRRPASQAFALDRARRESPFLMVFHTSLKTGLASGEIVLRLQGWSHTFRLRIAGRLSSIDQDL